MWVKLYKSGKVWVASGIAILSLVGLGQQGVNAISTDSSSNTNSTTESSSTSATATNQSVTLSSSTDTSSDTNATKKDGWVTENGSKYYYRNDVKLTGQQDIDGKFYLFDKETGLMQTGFQNLKDYGQDKVCYFDPSTGVMAHSDVTVNGVTYHFGKYGGELQSGWSTSNAGKVYVNSDGSLGKGQQYIDGSWRLFDNNGVMLTGFQDLSAYGANKTMYFDKDGKALYGQQYINGQYYVLSHNEGALLTGFQDLKSYGQDKVVYLDPNNGGAMAHGSITVDGVTYHFDTNGGWHNSGLISGWQTENGKKYYIQNDGSVSKGQQYINNNWYVFDNTGAMLTGFVDMQPYGANKTMYFDKDGQALYGQQHINSQYYLFSHNEGALLTGFQSLKDYGQDKVVYFDPNNGGAMAHNSVVVDGVTYNFYTGDGWTNGKVLSGWSTSTIGKVYVNSDGSLKSGELRDGGYYYYLSPDNHVMQTGFVTLPDGRKVYYNEQGHMIYGQQVINGAHYLFHSQNGSMQTGFQQITINGQKQTVYYDPATGQQVFGNQVINGFNYHFNETTGILENTDARGWQTMNGQRYYYNDQGMPTIGETHIGNYFYYFDNNGVMQTHKFINLGSKIGYYNDYGEMQYGQQYIDGKYYLFERNTGKMLTGLQDLHSYGESKTVFYNDDGSMFYGTRNVNGATLRFADWTGAMYFNPTYYAQNDGRWGNIYFGGYSMASSGCVMASIAMVSTGYGNTVTPLDAAWYGHSNSGFDNFAGGGADQRTLRDVAGHFGMDVRGLYGTGDIKNSLENGRPVLIAVQAPFIPWWGVTHEVVLSQYSNGNVYVSDPLGATSGWHNINDVWNNRSRDGGDSNVFGTPAVQAIR